MRRTFSRLPTFGLLTTLAVSCPKDELIVSQVDTAVQASDASATRDANLAMGNPSGAVTSASQYWNYLLVKPQFSMSYHRYRGIPQTG